MTKKKVFVTKVISQIGIDMLSKEFEVVVNTSNKQLQKKELIEKSRGFDAVLTMLSDQIDNDILQSLGSSCKIVANYAVGFNNIDLQSATKHKIIVTNTPGVLDNATADMAWALLFAVARNIVTADKFVKAGKFIDLDFMRFLGVDITGKTLGIIGAGRIGQNFAVKSKGFSMTVLYNDIKPNKQFEETTNACYVSKEELLTQSDFISLHVPLTQETRYLIDTHEFSLMKKNAVLINTSRGPVINEKALIDALKNKRIWGAGLDVYENEPKIEKELLELDNVVLLPHIGSGSFETRGNMAILAVKNIIEVLNGRQPITCVNKDVLANFAYK